MRDPIQSTNRTGICRLGCSGMERNPRASRDLGDGVGGGPESRRGGHSRRSGPRRALWGDVASDHLIVFGDFVLPDLTAPAPVFVAAGFQAGQLALYFVEPSGLPTKFELEARPVIGTGIWVRLNATLEGPDPQGRYRFLTSVPAAARQWRVRAGGPQARRPGNERPLPTSSCAGIPETGEILPPRRFAQEAVVIADHEHDSASWRRPMGPWLCQLGSVVAVAATEHPDGTARTYRIPAISRERQSGAGNRVRNDRCFRPSATNGRGVLRGRGGVIAWPEVDNSNLACYPGLAVGP